MHKNKNESLEKCNELWLWKSKKNLCVFLYAISYQPKGNPFWKLCTASCIATKSDFPSVIFPHIIICKKETQTHTHTKIHTHTHNVCVCYILFSFNCQTMSPSFSSIIFLFDGDLFSTLSFQNIKEISRFSHCLLFIFFSTFSFHIFFCLSLRKTFKIFLS